MAEAKFPMVNDFTGEEVESTLGDEETYRANGFRVIAGGQYDAAVAEKRAAEAAKVEPPQPTIVELQTRSDAALTAQRTYPAADPGDDKLSKKETVEPTDEGGQATQLESVSTDTAAHARAVGNEKTAEAESARAAEQAEKRRGNRK